MRQDLQEIHPGHLGVQIALSSLLLSRIAIIFLETFERNNNKYKIINSE